MPSGAVVAGDDASAASAIEPCLDREGRLPEVVLVAGDMARTMGGGTEGRVRPGATLVRAPVDVIRVAAADGRTGTALAHVVVRSARSRVSWWRGAVVLVMNAQFIGPYDVAPRSHPNDGRLDVVWVDPKMSLRQRLAARQRARTGTHLPHPQMRSQSLRAIEVSMGREVDVWLDGRWWASTTVLTVSAIPDAAVVLA
jgi:diacylglycerol kinase family enzyme